MLLTLLALAAPLPALATSDKGMEPISADRGPAALEVSTSLDSCGTLESKVVCKLDVSYNALAEATSYSATVTRADGSVVDYGGVAAGGTSLWVPYVGSGTYSVRVTAFGDPQRPNGGKPVISTETSRAKSEAKPRKSKNRTKVKARGATAQVEATSRGAPETDTGRAEATAEATPNCAAAAAPEPIAPEPLPEPPPEDLDPANPDEDADGIGDEQERTEYDAAVAEQQAAEAVAETPESIDC
ncbi:MAG: hypothetical protein ACRDLO_12770 [Solirubrobacterales bacterium]